MASAQENASMALFCDFENVALGVRDAQYDKFDIKRVLERLLLKGSIVVKKAYCDWERYKGFKATMHEANFELIEIPHVRQSGKNSADIRLVVDALDLCYTKSHVNTFVIISGDSDFSPLVSKLRENAKHVIGVGVKQSTSDLLIANCDEFIFYDDLVRESQRAAARREPAGAQANQRRSPDEDKRRRETMDARRTKGIEMAVETFEALVSERGDSGKMWASVLKEAIKRRNPGFSESYYGFRTFGNLLEEAQGRGLLEFGRDEKSGAYVYRSAGGGPAPARQQHEQALERDRDRDRDRERDRQQVMAEPVVQANAPTEVFAPTASHTESQDQQQASPSRRQGRGGRQSSSKNADGSRSPRTTGHREPQDRAAMAPEPMQMPAEAPDAKPVAAPVAASTPASAPVQAPSTPTEADASAAPKAKRPAAKKAATKKAASAAPRTRRKASKPTDEAPEQG